jgi:hypothetical protein
LNPSSSLKPLYSYIAIKENNVYLEQRGVGASCSLYIQAFPSPVRSLQHCDRVLNPQYKLPNADHPLLLSIERNVFLYHPSTQLVPVYVALSNHIYHPIVRFSRLGAKSSACVWLKPPASRGRELVRFDAIHCAHLGNYTLRRLEVHS